MLELKLIHVNKRVPRLLTHWDWDKMAATVQTAYWNSFSYVESIFFFIKVTLKFAYNGLINNKPAWALMVAWHQTGKKPLSAPMVASFTDAYMYHSATMS